LLWLAWPRDCDFRGACDDCARSFATLGRGVPVRARAPAVRSPGVPVRARAPAVQSPGVRIRARAPAVRAQHPVPRGRTRLAVRSRSGFGADLGCS